MIIDHLANLSAYASLNEYIPTVIEYISTHDMIAMPPGHYPIVGDDVYVNIDESNERTQAEAVIEFHRRMADIQLPLSIDETYGYASLALAHGHGYDESHDIGFAPDVAPQGYVTCQPGMFAIFFPQDGHAPLIGNPDYVIKKAIFKIKV